MKTIILLLILGCSILFFGCHDVTVGYLFTENAGYSKDTLYIFSIEGKIEKLEGNLEYLKEFTAELQKELDRLEEDANKLYSKLDEIYDAQDILYDEYYDPATTVARKEELMIEIQKLSDRADELYEQVGEVDQQQADISDQIDNASNELGMDSPNVIKEQIRKYQEQIDFNIPWRTSQIESVLGTEPIIYTVLDAKNTQGNGDKFMEYVHVQGGGLIYVDLGVEKHVPAGAYTVTLEIRNEGRTRIMEDVYTFVIQN